MNVRGFDQSENASARLEAQFFGGLPGEENRKRKPTVESDTKDGAFGGDRRDSRGQMVAGAAGLAPAFCQDDILTADANEDVPNGRREVLTESGDFGFAYGNRRKVVPGFKDVAGMDGFHGNDPRYG